MMLSKTINTWSKKNKENALQLLQQFGDIDEIITYFDNMIYRYQIGDDIYTINDKYYVHYNKKGLVVYATDSILCCYQSLNHPMPHSYTVGLILNNGATSEFTSFDRTEALEVYSFFCKVLPCIERQTPSLCPFEISGAFKRVLKVSDGKLIFYKKHKPFFAKEEKEKVYYKADASNLTWCYQVHHFPTEGPDDFNVNMAFRDGKNIVFQVRGNNFSIGCTQAVELILNLKKNVPHLLYGINKDYDKIFRKNPEELFALAIQKCDK